MAVTKQTYNINAGFTSVDVANALRSALIAAGLMTEWFDSFTISGNRICRVLRIVHDPTKTYGTCFYYFVIENGGLTCPPSPNLNPASLAPESEMKISRTKPPPDWGISRIYSHEPKSDLPRENRPDR